MTVILILLGLFFIIAGVVGLKDPKKLTIKKTGKVPSRLRIASLPIVGLVIFLIGVGTSGNSRSTSSAKPSPTSSASATSSPTATATTAPSPDPKQAVKDYVAVIMDKVMTPMQDGNGKVTAAGQAGQNKDFGTAKTDIDTALQDFNIAQLSLSIIRDVPPEMAHTNNLLNSALGKYIDGAQLMQEGINNFDPNTIIQGSKIYSQGTDFIKQATTELLKYQ